MKLALSQLESARKNPRKFASQPGRGFPIRANFKMYFVSAVKRFHEGMTEDGAVEYFARKAEEKLKLQNYYEQRLAHYKESLRNYCRLFSGEGLSFVQSSLPLKLRAGRHDLTGTVRNLSIRIDPSGYSVMLTQLEASEWTEELKWPLIQQAVSETMGCLPEEVDIRAFHMDDSSFFRHEYTIAQIAEAYDEARDLLDLLERLGYTATIEST